jgi:hypothetical protein
LTLHCFVERASVGQQSEKHHVLRTRVGDVHAVTILDNHPQIKVVLDIFCAVFVRCAASGLAGTSRTPRGRPASTHESPGENASPGPVLTITDC